ncbi:hypothetical protein XENTR_v10022603 [Xenopus tropicalis]|nr:hypothetical protein XENTR_v10022603 [Xenopus tropicalis]
MGAHTPNVLLRLQSVVITITGICNVLWVKAVHYGGSHVQCSASIAVSCYHHYWYLQCLVGKSNALWVPVYMPVRGYHHYRYIKCLVGKSCTLWVPEHPMFIS